MATSGDLTETYDPLPCRSSTDSFLTQNHLAKPSILSLEGRGGCEKSPQFSQDGFLDSNSPKGCKWVEGLRRVLAHHCAFRALDCLLSMGLGGKLVCLSKGIQVLLSLCGVLDWSTGLAPISPPCPISASPSPQPYGIGWDPEEGGGHLLLLIGIGRTGHSYRENRSTRLSARHRQPVGRDEASLFLETSLVLVTYLLKDDNEINPACSHFPS